MTSWDHIAKIDASTRRRVVSSIDRKFPSIAREDIEDIYGDVLLVLHREAEAGTVDLHEGTLASWMYVCVKNRCRTLLTQRERTGRHFNIARLSQLQTPLRNTHNGEKAKQLYDMLLEDARSMPGVRRCVLLGMIQTYMDGGCDREECKATTEALLGRTLTDAAYRTTLKRVRQQLWDHATERGLATGARPNMLSQSLQGNTNARARIQYQEQGVAA